LLARLAAHADKGIFARKWEGAFRVGNSLLLDPCRILAAILGASPAMAADTDNGKRVAETRCATRHIVAPSQRRDFTESTAVRADRAKISLESRGAGLRDSRSHPRMNVPLTRREAQDLAAYISTLPK
jgi:hypothetical protein